MPSVFTEIQQVGGDRLDSAPLGGRERSEQRVEVEGPFIPCATGEMQGYVVKRKEPITIGQLELEPVVDPDEQRFFLVAIQGQRWKREQRRLVRLRHQRGEIRLESWTTSVEKLVASEVLACDVE